MKQTAVEWLISELKKYDSAGLKYQSNYVIEMPTHILTELEEQAKEMEKEQQGYNQEKVFEIERFRAIDFAKWFSDFNGLTWEEKRVSKEHLNNLYEQYLKTLGGKI